MNTCAMEETYMYPGQTSIIVLILSRILFCFFYKNFLFLLLKCFKSRGMNIFNYATMGNVK